MPDIIMCDGTTCPIKKTCYRFTAFPNSLHQSWFTEVPYDHEKEACEYYMEVKSKSQMKRLKIMKEDKNAK